MFNITDGMARAWKEWGKPTATPEDVELVEDELGIKLPAEYVDFVTRYGFVLFGRDEPERRCLFSYVIQEDGQRVTRQCDISFLFNAEQLVPRYRYMTTTDDPQDETRPCIPPGFLAVGSDAGHSAILLDIAANPGQVWFWPYDDDRWGLGDNVALGFVADNFADFINSLQPDPL